MTKRRVLITPLDWGLGHASRCVPVIRELLQCNCDVIIGGSGDALTLLRGEFPHLKIIQLPPYAPVYSASSSLVWKMIQQLYKFIKTIKKEHQLVEQLVHDNRIDLIISDNRYGCWSKATKSIFITHQVTMLLPKRVMWLSAIVNWFNHHQIRNFDECWVPDWKPGGLAGRLSMTKTLPVKYIGLLSRFERDSAERKKTFDVLIVVSGPEPQRSIFEEMMLRDFKTTDLNVCLVRGVPGQNGKKVGKVCVVDFLNAKDIQSIIQQSNLLISRSGYSSIMDLAAVGGKVIFVPTPGQPEQEYLAQYFREKGIAFSIAQHEFDLNHALREEKKYSGFEPTHNNRDLLRKALKEVLE